MHNDIKMKGIRMVKINQLFLTLSIISFSMICYGMEHYKNIPKKVIQAAQIIAACALDYPDEESESITCQILENNQRNKFPYVDQRELQQIRRSILSDESKLKQIQRSDIGDVFYVNSRTIVAWLKSERNIKDEIYISSSWNRYECYRMITIYHEPPVRLSLPDFGEEQEPLRQAVFKIYLDKKVVPDMVWDKFLDLYGVDEPKCSCKNIRSLNQCALQ